MKHVVITLLLAIGISSFAQTYDTNNISAQTFVGSGFYGHVDGQGAFTMFNYPSAIAVDSSSNFFVLDNQNYSIRKVTATGTVTTFIGGGLLPPPGYGTNVYLGNYNLLDMAIDHSNNLWIVTGNSLALLKIAPDGLVLPIAIPGNVYANGICVDSSNNLYLADFSANRIYRHQPGGSFEVFAGSGNPGDIDGNGIFTSFRNPFFLAADANDNIYVWDSGNFRIRRVSQNRDVSTLAGSINSSPESDGHGTNAVIQAIHGMTVDINGNLLFSSGYYWFSGHQGTSIRRMSPALDVTTIAGSFTNAGYANGTGSNALFQGVKGLCVLNGEIYAVDSANQRIRRISMEVTEQVVAPADLELATYPGLKITGTIGRVYRIESSTNMNTWSDEAELQLATNPQLWIDPAPVGGKKFYRAVLLP